MLSFFFLFSFLIISFKENQIKKYENENDLIGDFRVVSSRRSSIGTIPTHLREDSLSGTSTLSLEEFKKSFSKDSIERMGKDFDSLLLLFFSNKKVVDFFSLFFLKESSTSILLKQVPSKLSQEYRRVFLYFLILKNK